MIPAKELGVPIIVVLVLAILVMPLMEALNAFRIKLYLQTSLFNSIRASAGRSVESGNKSFLDSDVNDEEFYNNFAEAFNLSVKSGGYSYPGAVTIFGENNQFNPITVDIQFYRETEGFIADEGHVDEEDYVTSTTITATATTDYKFQSSLLQGIAKDGLELKKMEVKQVYKLEIAN